MADHLLIETSEFFIEQPEYPGDICECLEIFLVVRTEVKVLWYLVGGGQGAAEQPTIQGTAPTGLISIELSLGNLVVRSHSRRSNSKSVIYLIQLNNSFLHEHQLPLQVLCSRTVNVRSIGWAVGGIGNSYYNSPCSKLHTFHLKTSDNSMTSNLYKPLSMFLSKSSLSCYEANSLFCVK